MQLLISDANIFIDFEDGGLLEELFDLGVTIAVPDVLFEDELRDQHEALLEHGLRLMSLKAAAVERTIELASRYRRPSRLDLAALALAEQEGCPLVTGDRRLREAADHEGVEVHGTLWVAELLCTEGIVSVAQLRVAYARMRGAGRRLPWQVVEEQLQRLEEQP